MRSGDAGSALYPSMTVWIGRPTCAARFAPGAAGGRTGMTFNSDGGLTTLNFRNDSRGLPVWMYVSREPGSQHGTPWLRRKISSMVAGRGIG